MTVLATLRSGGKPELGERFAQGKLRHQDDPADSPDDTSEEAKNRLWINS